MSNHFRSGPSGEARWEERPIGDGRTPPRSVLLLPDAGGAAGALYYVLPAAPLLQRDSAQRLVLSLTLMLTRQPEPGDLTIYPLIERGTLGLGLTLALPPTTLPALRQSASDPSEFRPLFARDVQLRLDWPEGAQMKPVASVSGSGADARLALSAELDRQQAVDCLAALQGRPSSLRVSCLVRYRTASIPHTLRLTGSWAAIHDYLSTRTDPAQELGQAELQRHVVDMVSAGVLRVEDLSSPNGAGPDPATLLLPFLRLSSVILSRVTPELSLDDVANRYSLRARPHEMFGLDLEHTLASPVEESIELVAALHEIAGDALKGLELDPFIHLVSLAAGGEIGPAPRRMRTGRPPNGARGAAAEPSGLAALGGQLQSLGLSLRTDATAVPPARALLGSDAIEQRKVLPGNIGRWLVNDLRIEKPVHAVVAGVTRMKSLPVVEDPGAAVWPDRVRANEYWYAPVFEVVSPAANADRELSPFLFRFVQSGHDLSGRPGLEATIRFTLRAAMSAASQAALQGLGKPPARPVATEGLSVRLALPFRDQSGATRSQLFPADVARSAETITATVRLIDDWVRLCYGALAVAGFQTDPPRLETVYTYRAYVPLDPNRIHLVFGGKIAITPVAYSLAQVRELGDRPHVSATDVSLRLPMGELRFVREAAARAGGPRPAIATAAHGLAGGHLLAGPHIELTPVVASLAAKRRLGIQTVGQQASVDVFFPCNTLGAFYVQASGDGQTAIGCRDHLQLGQITYRQYQKIDALQHPLYSVYRSLQQPGRFLVVPSRYGITRFAPTEGERAYRPAVFLYSSVDAERPEANRCVVMATLEPVLPRFAREELLTKLASHAAAPVVEFVTEIDSELAYSWALSGAAGIEPKAAKLWDSFQVSLATSLDAAPQLQAMLQTGGVSANVSFTLPDGSLLQTTLELDLADIVGPWTEGPIETTIGGGAAVLRNRIERGVNVSDLLLAGSGAASRVPVERLLRPDESVTVPEVSAAAAYPVYTVAPGSAATLAEIRSFIEDIHTNVVFVNLVNYGNHALKKLELRARLKAVEGTQSLQLSESEPVASVEFVLPLTTYLASRVLEFQVTKVNTSDQAATTPWLEWPLDSRGNVVSLTWELIQ